MIWYRVVGKRAEPAPVGSPANVLIVNGRVAVCTFLPSTVGDSWRTLRARLEAEFLIEELTEEE